MFEGAYGLCAASLSLLAEERYKYSLRRMTYELAKKLKDAGFPKGNQLNTPHPQFFEDENHEKPIRTPTLTELLFSVETHLVSLEPVGVASWVARGDKKEFTGPTPIEAVANLWFALNSPTSPS